MTNLVTTVNPLKPEIKFSIRKRGFSEFKVPTLFGDPTCKVESIVKDGLIMHRATTLLDKCHKDPINALRNFLRSKENILAFVMETDKILSDHPHLAKNLNGEFHHLNYEFFRKNGEEVQPLLTAKDYQDNGILGVFIKSKKGGTYLSSYIVKFTL